MTDRAFDRAISATVERQMRHWALAQEVQLRLPPKEAARRLPAGVHPWVAISREAGSGGGEVARRLAAEIGCDSYGRDLLDSLAERYDLSKSMVGLIDEQRTSWLQEVFGYWLDSHTPTQIQYLRHLGELVLLAARAGRAVFVGRGAQFFLPRDRGIAVRIVAPRDQRAQRLAEARGIELAAARTLLDDLDGGRQELVSRHFHRDIADPALYDLVLNLEQLTIDDAVALIAGAHRRRFETPGVGTGV